MRANVKVGANTPFSRHKDKLSIFKAPDLFHGCLLKPHLSICHVIATVGKHYWRCKSKKGLIPVLIDTLVYMRKHTNGNYSKPLHSRLCKHAQRVMSGLRQQALCLSSVTCETPEPTLRDERLHSELILLSGYRVFPPRNDVSHG